MGPSIDLTAREKEILRIVKALGRGTDGFVVIGGYAVNAHGAHRFSVDCDLATRQDHLPALVAILQREGYTLHKPTRSQPLLGTLMRRYTKRFGRERAGVELYLDKVVCRQTEGSWSYGLIDKNSLEAIVVGATESTPSRVVGRELLASMKLHAGRAPDIRDVVVLSEGMNWEAVAGFAACGSREKVNRQLESALERTTTEKFRSDLRSSFALRADASPLIKHAVRGLEMLRKLLSDRDFRPSL